MENANRRAASHGPGCPVHRRGQRSAGPGYRRPPWAAWLSEVRQVVNRNKRAYHIRTLIEFAAVVPSRSENRSGNQLSLARTIESKSTAAPRIGCSDDRLVAPGQFPETGDHNEATCTRPWKTEVARASKGPLQQALRTNARPLVRSCTSQIS